MRPLETAIVLLLILAWISYLLPASRRPRWLLVLPVLPAVISVIQLIVEQYHWQMVPAYVLAGVLFIFGLPPIRRSAQPAAIRTGLRQRIFRIARMGLGFFTLIIAGLVPLSLPIFQLPIPTGPYAVGTTALELVDESRTEVYPPDATTHRDLMVQVWYPAKPDSEDSPQPYVADDTGTFLAADLGLPSFIFDHLSLIQTHTYPDAALANAQALYPVLVFSHGYGGVVGQNTVQMEELASHGYIIFSIGHPYGAAVVVFPNDRTVPNSPTQTKAFPIDSGPEIEPTFEQCKADPDPVAAKACWQHFVSLTPTLHQIVGVWTQDTRFVLDELEHINTGERPSPFTGRLDLDRIGVFGHSLGGATAAEVCLADSRCKAGVNMDGFQFGSSLFDHPIQQPFMIMYSQAGLGVNDYVYNEVENDAYRISIPEAQHANFTDMSLQLPPVPLGASIGLVGSIDGQRMETIINRYLVAFFDQYLMSIPSPLLDQADPDYPEVDFQKHQDLSEN